MTADTATRLDVAGAGVSTSRLLAASTRNLGARLFSAGLTVAAALPLMPIIYPVVWFALNIANALMEQWVVSRPQRPGFALFGVPAPQLAVRLTSGVVSVAAAYMFWSVDSSTAKLFGIILICVSLLYILMQYYARAELLLLIASPYLLAVVAGASQIIAGHFRHHQPWLAVTTAISVVYLLHFMARAREQLADSRLKLQTARAEAQAQSASAEAANAAKSVFLATMSHEIRTPLNGVLGMAQAMAFDPLTPIQQERLGVIRQSGEALLAILNDVLDLSKIEAGRFELEDVEFDLEALARGAHSAFTALANKQGLSFGLTLAERARGAYRGDPTRIRQILYNLISNALKFTPSGEVRVDADYVDGQLILTVSDTGIGIPADRLSALFEKFVQVDASTTRRFGGTGLGLAICRRLAELMGGSITVDSAVGRGTRFVVALSLARLERPSLTIAHALSPPVAQHGERDIERVRVLAAEDNKVNQLVLRTLLAQAGIEPEIVENGEQALQAWRRQAWDVILMDMQMPVMDGATATRLIRGEEAASGRRRTPIIALTANAMAHQIVDYLATGMDGHVAKPVEASRLFAALAEVVDGEGEAGMEAVSA
jgi:signal transduction histidine kinase/ActR/RegA family two-component response regulator